MSQLLFITKIIETIVAKQLNNYVLYFNILNPKQSRFRTFYST